MNPDCLEKGTEFKSTGVRRIFVLATSPCKETYDNAKIIFEKLNISQLFAFEWRLCADLKFINVFVGIGPHSSTHPCFVCTWRRGEKTAGTKRKFSDILSSFPECSTKKGKPKDHLRFFTLIHKTDLFLKSRFVGHSLQCLAANRQTNRLIPLWLCGNNMTSTWLLMC